MVPLNGLNVFGGLPLPPHSQLRQLYTIGVYALTVEYSILFLYNHLMVSVQEQTQDLLKLSPGKQNTNFIKIFNVLFIL